MEQPIGIRLPQEIMQKIERMSRKEMEDRSTTIRKLLIIGYQQKMKEHAIDEYKRGKSTLTEAARRAGLTLWEMEQELIFSGFKSEYSADDLQKEIALLNKEKRR